MAVNKATSEQMTAILSQLDDFITHKQTSRKLFLTAKSLADSDYEVVPCNDDANSHFVQSGRTEVETLARYYAKALEEVEQCRRKAQDPMVNKTQEKVTYNSVSFCSLLSWRNTEAV